MDPTTTLPRLGSIGEWLVDNSRAHDPRPLLHAAKQLRPGAFGGRLGKIARQSWRTHLAAAALETEKSAPQSWMKMNLRRLYCLFGASMQDDHVTAGRLD